MRLAVGVDVGEINSGSYAVGVRGMHGKWANTTLGHGGRPDDLQSRYSAASIWEGLPVLLEDIDRIEVVRGPGGAAWGANAANGVINIITKKPGDTPGFFLTQTLTDRLDSITEMRYGFTTGKLDLRLSAAYDSLPETGVLEGPEGHDFCHLARANLRSTYHFDKEHSLDIDAGYINGVEGAPAEVALLSGNRLRRHHLVHRRPLPAPAIHRAEGRRRPVVYPVLLESGMVGQVGSRSPRALQPARPGGRSGPSGSTSGTS